MAKQFRFHQGKTVKTIGYYCTRVGPTMAQKAPQKAWWPLRIHLHLFPRGRA